jgi:hypothetical protein
VRERARPNNEVRLAVLELVALSMNIPSAIADVTVTYSPHVEQVSLVIFPGGYDHCRGNETKVIHLAEYVDEADSLDRVRRLIKAVLDLIPRPTGLKADARHALAQAGDVFDAGGRL